MDQGLHLHNALIVLNEMFMSIMARCTCLQDIALECETFRETEPTPPQDVLCNIPRCLNREGRPPPSLFPQCPLNNRPRNHPVEPLPENHPLLHLLLRGQSMFTDRRRGVLALPGPSLPPLSLLPPSRPTWTPTRGDRLDFGTEIDGFGQIENEKNRLVTEGDVVRDKMSDATFP